MPLINLSKIVFAALLLTGIVSISIIGQTPEESKAAADRQYAAGEALNRQQTGESVAAAVEKYLAAASLYQKAGELAGEARSYNKAGSALNLLGDKRRAFEIFSKAIPLAERLGNPINYAIALNNVGMLASALGDKQTALASIQKAAGIMNVQGDRTSEAALLSNIGTIYEDLGGREKALKFYNDSLVIRREVKDEEGIALTLSNIGVTIGATGDQQTALKYFSEALPLTRKTGDRPQEAKTLINIGAVYDNLSDYKNSLKHYDLARTICRAIGDKATEAVLLNNLANVANKTGDNKAALKYLRDALVLRRETGDIDGEAIGLSNIANIEHEYGENQNALDHLNAALQLARRTRNKTLEATFLSNLGQIYQSLGDPQMALKYALESLPIRQAVSDKNGEAVTLNNIGLLYGATGEWKLSLKFYNEALTLLRAVGDRQMECVTISNIGAAHNSLGDRQTALKYYLDSLAIARAIGNRSQEAITLSNIGEAYTTLSNLDLALKYLNESLAISRELGKKGAIAAALGNIGSVYDNRRDYDNALKFFKESIQLRRELEDRSGEALMLNNIGNTLDNAGNYSEARDYYEIAVSAVEISGDRSQKAVTLSNLMLFWKDRGNLRYAAAWGKLSVNTFQQLRSNARGLNKSLQQSYLRSMEESYRGLANILFADGRLVEAQALLNSLKDQEYFDANAKELSPLEYTSREDAFVKEINEKIALIGQIDKKFEARYRELGSPSPENSNIPELDKLGEDSAAAIKEYKAALAKAEKLFAEKDQTPVSQTKDLTNLQSVIGEISQTTGRTSVAVYTFMGETEFGALVVTGDDIFYVSTPVKRFEINKKALNFWKLLRSPRYDPKPAAAELYDIILKPVAERLPAGTHTILWSLDGNLRYVPMAALFDGKNYLAERYENVVFTRADKERLTRSTSQNMTGSGFGSSKAHTVELSGERFNASALPSVKTEMVRIFQNKEKGGLPGSVMLDQQFTRPAMMAAMKQRRPLVHIASHFKFEPGDEARSFLLLGDGTPFTLDEMKKETDLFAGVDLLTLSACETAAQKPDANGREVDGFAELAQRLGAGAVMASLWEVSDDSTAELMARFYRNYRGPARASKASSLREAQLALLTGKYNRPLSASSRQLIRENTEPITDDKVKLKPYRPTKRAPFAHPYYWSPFVLIGNWK